MNSPPAVSFQKIKNFTRLSPLLYRGSAPGFDDLIRLKEMKVRAIVDFQNHPDRNEKILAEKIGLKYIPIPWSAYMYRSIFYFYVYRIAKRFLEVAADPENLPLYVHCFHGRERTGTMIAVWRMAVDQWPCKKARDEFLSYGVNPWLNFHLLWFLNRFHRTLKNQAVPDKQHQNPAI